MDRFIGQWTTILSSEINITFVIANGTEQLHSERKKLKRNEVIYEL
jgi:hypothetical protein